MTVRTERCVAAASGTPRLDDVVVADGRHKRGGERDGRSRARSIAIINRCAELEQLIGPDRCFHGLRLLRTVLDGRGERAEG
jgi:hypothetical protein